MSMLTIHFAIAKKTSSKAQGTHIPRRSAPSKIILCGAEQSAYRQHSTCKLPQLQRRSNRQFDAWKTFTEVSDVNRSPVSSTFSSFCDVKLIFLLLRTGGSCQSYKGPCVEFIFEEPPVLRCKNRNFSSQNDEYVAKTGERFASETSVQRPITRRCSGLL